MNCFSTGASSYSDALFGQGRGSILLNNVACTGTESRLFDCNSDPIGVTGSCTHEDDAGVGCRTCKYWHIVSHQLGDCVLFPLQAMCTNGDLSLVGGLSDNEGRLELCYNNQWGTVCDDGWSQASTNVACRQLGVTDNTHGLSLFFHIAGLNKICFCCRHRPH